MEAQAGVTMLGAFLAARETHIETETKNPRGRQRMSEMTEDEAIQLGIKAIRHATFRDAYSGGFINVYLISREGWKKVFTEDLASIPDAENPEGSY